MADAIYREAGRRGVELDPARQSAAAKRHAEALRNAKYHEQRAAAERAKADQIARTWGLPAETLDSGAKSE